MYASSPPPLKSCGLPWLSQKYKTCSMVSVPPQYEQEACARECKHKQAHIVVNCTMHIRPPSTGLTRSDRDRSAAEFKEDEGGGRSNKWRHQLKIDNILGMLYILSPGRDFPIPIRPIHHNSRKSRHSLQSKIAHIHMNEFKLDSAKNKESDS